jgi:prefoldin subunit 5
MTKEKLEAKLKEYQAQYEQLKANVNALSGAIQAIQNLLDEFEAETKKEETV